MKCGYTYTMLLLSGSLALSTPAGAATFKSLYSFPSANDGSDGEAPTGGLVFRDGHLYGTTSLGGDESGRGVIYKLSTRTNKLKVIYRFQGAADGENPIAGLIDYDHMLYGGTLYGNPADGAIDKLDPSTDTVSVAYSFPDCEALPCSTTSPYGFAAHKGTFYGVGNTGGSDNNGTIFSFDPNTSTETELYSFKAGADGLNPQGAPLFLDGKLYGTTDKGGTGYAGTLFSYDLKRKTEKVLYTFPGGTGGSRPQGPLVYYNGSLYGIAAGSQQQVGGLIYRYDLKSGQESNLFLFSKKSSGFTPVAGLTLLNGKLYGSTQVGGKGGGTVFEYSISTGHLSTLYAFSGPDGSEPFSPLLYRNGTFFGTTYSGGAHNEGTIFSITP